MRVPIEALRLLQRRESVCRGRVSLVEAIKVPLEAVRVLIMALRVPIMIVGSPKRLREYTTLSPPQQHSHSFGNGLLYCSVGKYVEQCTVKVRISVTGYKVQA